MTHPTSTTPPPRGTTRVIHPSGTSPHTTNPSSRAANRGAGAAAYRERPILFSGPMVQTLLDGRKTQTRRVVKPQPAIDAEGWWNANVPKGQLFYRDGAAFSTLRASHASMVTEALATLRCPYGKPGDRLYVKEMWLHIDDEGDRFDGMGSQTYYAATSNSSGDAAYMQTRGLRWRPSIFMPRWASRILLEVTDVRVERLQDISEADAKAEGVEPCIAGVDEHGDPIKTHRTGFVRAWTLLNEKRGYPWCSNPWVWAITFRRIEP